MYVLHNLYIGGYLFFVLIGYYDSYINSNILHYLCTTHTNMIQNYNTIQCVQHVQNITIYIGMITVEQNKSEITIDIKKR